MTKTSKYRFSFTAASLMHKELCMYANILVDANFDLKALDPEVLNRGKGKTNKREFAEIKLRICTLSRLEIEFLANTDLTTQKHIAYLACCRAYAFVREFVLEVVVEKTNIFDFQITERDYLTFFNKKAIDHEELDNLAESTKYKVKQVVFKILEQANIIDSVKTKNIIPPIIDMQLFLLLQKTQPNDLHLLFAKQN